MLEKRLLQIPFAGRFALLFFFLLGSIVFYPYAETSGLGYYAFRIIGALIVLLTVWAVTFNRQLLFLVVVLAIPSILQHLLHQQGRGNLLFINRILSIGFDLLIITIIGRHIFKTDKPNAETIFGALSIYLLLGFTFASIYSALADRVPGAFYLTPALNIHAMPDRFDFIYFSFGTLTELGTPGITAVAPGSINLSPGSNSRRSLHGGAYLPTHQLLSLCKNARYHSLEMTQKTKRPGPPTEALRYSRQAPRISKGNSVTHYRVHAAGQMETSCSLDVRPCICNNVRASCVQRNGGTVSERLPARSQSVPAAMTAMARLPG